MARTCVSAERGFQEEKAGGSGSSDKEGRRGNREILWVGYAFIGIFVLLLANFTYFIAVRSPDVINSPYNRRQDILAERFVRGKILARDGEVLAETTSDGEGNEVRSYPYGRLFCHVVGRFSNGQTGVERLRNIHLLTCSEDPLTKAVRDVRGEKSPGDNAVTTLDVGLQKAAYEALGDRRGAIVAIEPSTGKILAMVSKPDYDPNQIDSLWDSLLEDAGHESALLNRATQGLYPPGSTFKILTALEYLRENESFDGYSYDCSGRESFGEVTIRCYGGESHGEEGILESFADSCNTSFANIGMTLDKGKLRKLCDGLLFNAPLPTDLEQSESQFPLDAGSEDAEVPQTAIGQGETQITPLHNAMIVAAIANKGVMMEPYVVDRMETQDGKVVRQYEPKAHGAVMTREEAKELRKLLKAVVTQGTASSLSSLPVSCAGKTGSAEYDSDKSSHGWFVGYAPAEDPQIAVSILVEDGGTGSQSAVPIARRMLEEYFG